MWESQQTRTQWRVQQQRNGVFCAVHAERLQAGQLFVGQSPVSKNVSTEAEDIVDIRHQVMAGEYIADWGEFVRAVMNCSVWD
jgi:hypothetical protein